MTSTLSECPSCGRVAIVAKAGGLCASCSSDPDAVAEQPPQAELSAVTRGAGSEMLCGLLGAVLLAIGFSLLIFFPGEGGVVNLQRLYIGQTTAIVGGVFLAAAARPR